MCMSAIWTEPPPVGSWQPCCDRFVESVVLLLRDETLYCIQVATKRCGHLWHISAGFRPVSPNTDAEQ